MLGIKERGSTKIFRRKIFVSWWRIFRRATLLCSVSEIFRERRNLWIKRGAGIKIFRRKIFHSHCRKASQGNPLLFHYFQVSKNVKDKRKWGASRFSAEKFLSHSAEYFVGQTFCAVFQKFSGSEKVYG